MTTDERLQKFIKALTYPPDACEHYGEEGGLCKSCREELQEVLAAVITRAQQAEDAAKSRESEVEHWVQRYRELEEWRAQTSKLHLTAESRAQQAEQRNADLKFDLDLIGAQLGIHKREEIEGAVTRQLQAMQANVDERIRNAVEGWMQRADAAESRAQQAERSLEQRTRELVDESMRLTSCRDEREQLKARAQQAEQERDELRSDFDSFREHHRATEQSAEARDQALRALIEKWRLPEHDFELRETLNERRQCADELAALLSGGETQ